MVKKRKREPEVRTLVLRNPEFAEVMNAAGVLTANELLYLADCRLDEQQRRLLTDGGIAVIEGRDEGQEETTFYCLAVESKRRFAERTVAMIVERYFKHEIDIDEESS